MDPWLKWAEEQRQNILRDYQQDGAALHALESRYHHNWAVIRAFLRAQGVHTRGYPSERFLHCPEDVKHAILRDYQAGIAIWRLSIKYEYPRYSIARFLKSQGVKIYRSAVRYHTGRVCTTSALRTFAERLAFAIDHCARPLTSYEISAVMQGVHNDNRRRNANLAEKEVAGA